MEVTNSNTSENDKTAQGLMSNPAIEKLLEYAKSKSAITWDDIISYLGQEFVNSDDLMEPVLDLLKNIGREPIETDIIEQEVDDGMEDDLILETDDDLVTDDDETISEIEKAEKASRNKLVNNDKDSSIDDPIRLYLREIGKENLLTAEQEVELSKTMEQGNNIIKNVIINSGIMIPEFYAVAQKAFSRIDIHEPGKTRKEINEEMADKRRLKSSYGEHIKPVLSEIKQYMQLKRQLFETNQSN